MMTTKKECLLWRVECLDGGLFGVTDFDQDISYEGLIYQSQGAVVPSEVEKQMGLSPDNLEILGAVQHQIFDEKDLLAGRFDGAKIIQMLWDWEEERIIRVLFEGRITDVEFSENRFRANVESGFEKIESNFGRSFQKQCHAIFCDDKCALNPKKFETDTIFLSSQGRKWRVEKTGETRWWKDGLLMFKNQYGKLRKIGIRDVVEGNYYSELELWETPFEFPREGQKIILRRGCNKSFSMCRDIYDNAPNFRGFPHMPGEKILNRNLVKNEENASGFFK